MNTKDFKDLAEAISFFEEKSKEGLHPTLRQGTEGNHIVEWAEPDTKQLLLG